MLMKLLALVAIASLLPPTGMSATATSVCTPGPFIVFFKPDSSILRQEQIVVLDNVIEIAGECGRTSHLSGHADTAEDATIVRDRLRAVQNYFASRGLFTESGNMTDEGAEDLRVTTGPKVSERQNRRVEIIFTS